MGFIFGMVYVIITASVNEAIRKMDEKFYRLTILPTNEGRHYHYSSK